jgi:EmrB/QacA subfamily drug resistance transporter
MNDQTPLLRAGPTAEAASLDHTSVRAIVAGIMLAMFLSALEQTIVAPALPTIGRALGNVELLSWMVTGYLISTTVVTPLFGKLSDIYGRRRMMLVSIGVFILGSVACALAPSMEALIVGRVLQGVGGGGILPLAQTVIADLLSPRERPLIQSYTSAMFLAASILGPVLGGFLTDYVHWSLIFWINLPMGLVALILTDRALRRLPRNDRPHRLDLAGAGLMVAAALALLLALAWGGVRYPWTSPTIVGLFAASAALWVAFAWRLLHAAEPFIPLTMLAEPVVLGIAAAGFFSIGTIVGLSIFIPIYVELVLAHSPSASGLVLIAFMVGATIGSMVAGRLMPKLERYKLVPVFAMPIGVAAMILFAISPGDITLVEATLLLAVGGAGMGPMWPATTVIIQNAVPLHQLGIATGTLSFFRQLGGALVVAIFAAIVLAGVHGASLERLSAAETAALAASFRWVFIAAAVFLALSLLSLMVIKTQPLRGPAAARATESVSKPQAFE